MPVLSLGKPLLDSDWVRARKREREKKVKQLAHGEGRTRSLQIARIS